MPCFVSMWSLFLPRRGWESSASASGAGLSLALLASGWDSHTQPNLLQLWTFRANASCVQYHTDRIYTGEGREISVCCILVANDQHWGWTELTSVGLCQRFSAARYLACGCFRSLGNSGGAFLTALWASSTSARSQWLCSLL